jgi:hypothetical protein
MESFPDIQWQGHHLHPGHSIYASTLSLGIQPMNAEGE